VCSSDLHPEVRVEQVAEWVRGDRLPNGDEIVAELRDRIDEWQAFGAELCRAFLAAAERHRTAVTVSDAVSRL